MEWIPEPREAGYYGGPSLKTTECQSPAVNGHVVKRDVRDVSINYRDVLGTKAPFPARLSGPCVKGSNVSLPRPFLSKSKLRKLRRYGIVPAELKLYTDKDGILPDAIIGQYL